MRDATEKGSLAWCAADFRSLLPGGSAGLLQLMYPALGHAVMEHSAFVQDPFGRVYRSIPQIWATILTAEGDDRARHVRELHRDIKGALDDGAKYHALDPDTFWWAHATFTWEMFRSIQLFHRRQLSVNQKEDFYAETVEWYERYGVSTRPVPADYDSFVRRFVEVCTDELEMTPAAEYAVAIAARGNLGLPLIPPRAMRLIRPMLKSPGRAIAFGCLPKYVRDRMRIPWTSSDRRAFTLMATTVQTGGSLVPGRVNRRALRFSLRQVGARTRHDRYDNENGSR
jgi:uncharacterized protein (DUF2236 family)